MYGALAVTIAVLLRLINFRFLLINIINIIIITLIIVARYSLMDVVGSVSLNATAYSHGQAAHASASVGVHSNLVRVKGR